MPADTAATVNGALDLNQFSASMSSLTGSGTIDTVAGGTPTLTVQSGIFSGTLQNTAGSLALEENRHRHACSDRLQHLQRRHHRERWHT